MFKKSLYVVVLILINVFNKTLLCSEKIELNFVDSNGRNQLMIAVINNNLELVKELIEKHNFNIHLVDNNYDSAFDLTLKYNCEEIEEYLNDKLHEEWLKVIGELKPLPSLDLNECKNNIDIHSKLLDEMNKFSEELNEWPELIEVETVDTKVS